MALISSFLSLFFSSFVTVYAFTFNFGTPSQCDNISITWSGGTPPFQLSIIPTYEGMQNVSIPSSAYNDGQGSYEFQLPLAQNSQFLLTMSDATGFNAGGTSDVLIVQPSISGSHCNTTFPSVKFIFYATSLQQCSPFTFSGYTQATQPVTVAAMVPGGSVFLITQPTGESSFDWIANVAQGTSMVFTMTDALGITGGTSHVTIVGDSTDTTCLTEGSLSSTTNPPSTSSTTALSPSSSSPSSSSPSSLSTTTTAMIVSSSSKSPSTSDSLAATATSLSANSPTTTVALLGQSSPPTASHGGISVAGISLVIGSLFLFAVVITLCARSLRKRRKRAQTSLGAPAEQQSEARNLNHDSLLAPEIPSHRTQPPLNSSSDSRPVESNSALTASAVGISPDLRAFSQHQPFTVRSRGPGSQRDTSTDNSNLHRSSERELSEMLRGHYQHPGTKRQPSQSYPSTRNSLLNTIPPPDDTLSTAGSSKLPGTDSEFEPLNLEQVSLNSSNFMSAARWRQATSGADFADGNQPRVIVHTDAEDVLPLSNLDNWDDVLDLPPRYSERSSSSVVPGPSA